MACNCEYCQALRATPGKPQERPESIEVIAGVAVRISDLQRQTPPNARGITYEEWQLREKRRPFWTPEARARFLAGEIEEEEKKRASEEQRREAKPETGQLWATTGGGNQPE